MGAETNVSIHPAYWLLKQLHSQISDPSWHINIRCIHNKRPYEENGKIINGDTKVTFNENIPITAFKARWEGELLQYLTMLNESPSECSNIYFGVNPRIDGNSKSNKADNAGGYVAFYLDCDDNKSYTKQQRTGQIEFWKMNGFAPSVLVDSGNGYHPYWLFNRLVSAAEGQPILKKMVALSGCKDKGNTHDVTRILRLPGFKNVKTWWKDEPAPICALIEPDFHSVEACNRFDLEQFADHFMPSEREQIEEYYARAHELGEGIDFGERVRMLVQAAMKARLEQRIATEGQALAALGGSAEHVAELAARLSQSVPDGGSTEVTEHAVTPKRRIVPLISDLKWPKGKNWMKKYCLVGWDGLTEEEKQDIGAKYTMERVDLSAFDMKIMCALVSMGYTFEACDEFWRRGDVKLYREEKLLKNANYLRVTYDKALEYCRALFEQTRVDNLQGKSEPKVVINHGQTMIMKSTGNVDTVCTGEMILQGKYFDEDATQAIDREWFDLRIVLRVGKDIHECDMLLPGRAFSSIAMFKEMATREYFRLVTNEGSNLQRVLRYLEETYPGVPRSRFHSKITYRDGAFMFPKTIVNAQGVHSKDDVLMQDELKRRFPIYKWFDGRFLKPEHIRNFIETNWGNLLTMHLPRLVAAVIGSIGISAIKPIIEEKLEVSDFHLPTLSIRGASHSGKTETVKKLCTLTGVLPGKNFVSTESTMFAIQRTLELTNFVPMVIDEFKMVENGANAPKLEQIRSLVRRVYSGESMLRGRANMDVQEFQLHAPLIVMGEHTLERVGDVSEYSRVMPITTDEYKTDHNVDKMFAVQDVKYEWLSPLFYAFVLELDPLTCYNEFKTLRTEVIQLLKQSFAGERMRIGHNVAAIWYGCRLWDKFIRKYSPSAPLIEDTLKPQECLVQYIKDMAVENKQSLIVKLDGNTGESLVFSNNEFFKMLQVYAELNDLNDQVLKDVVAPHSESDADDTLSLNLPGVHKLYREYMQKQHKTVPDLPKIMSYIKAAKRTKEPWLLEVNKNKKIGEKVLKVAVLKLSMIKKMDIWLAPTVKNNRTSPSGNSPLPNQQNNLF